MKLSVCSPKSPDAIEVTHTSTGPRARGGAGRAKNDKHLGVAETLKFAPCDLVTTLMIVKRI